MKLELQKVRLKNFFSYGAKWTEILFNAGVNIVVGKNAQGKSAMLESIPFALFGQVHRNIKKEQIVNWKNKKKCEVHLLFKKGNTPYKIIRGIKPDKFEIYKDGVLIPKPSHVKYYQQTLEEIIGLNYQTFMSLIHSNINSSKPILSMKKPEKRKFMEKVFGLELYTKLNEKSNNKIRTINEKIYKDTICFNHNVYTINDAKDRISKLERNLSALNVSQIELNEARERLKDMEISPETLIDQINNIKQKIKELESQFAYYKMVITSVEGKRDLMNFKVRNGIETLEGIRLREEKLKDSVERRKRLDLLLKDHGGIEKIQKEIETGKTGIEEVEGKLKYMRSEWHRASIFYNTIGNDIKIKEEIIEKLDKKGICPTCGQKLNKDCDHLVNDTKEELLHLRNDHKKKERLMISIGNREEILEGEVTTRKKILSKYEDLLKKIYNLQAKIGSESVEDFESEKTIMKNKMRRYESAITKLLNAISRMVEKQSRIDRKIYLLEEEEMELQTELVDIRGRKETVKRLEEKVAAEVENRRQLKEIINTDKKSVSKLIEDNKIIEKKKIRYKEMIDYLEHIKVLCKDEHVKQYAISTIMPYLNKRTNYYLSEVGHPFYVTIDKWLEADIKGPGITKGTYGSLSGGEGRSIDLALQLALLDVARVQAGAWPDMTVFDELLDSSVDRESIGKLMEIIETKQHDEVNSKIFIISHRPEIGDEFEADNEYSVEKIDGYSKVNIK